eukprot:8634627-Pyramimonas_sp.AAC.3
MQLKRSHSPSSPLGDAQIHPGPPYPQRITSQNHVPASTLLLAVSLRSPQRFSEDPLNGTTDEFACRISLTTGRCVVFQQRGFKP